MKTFLCALVTLFAWPWLAVAQDFGRTTYLSPDARLRAVVSPVRLNPRGFHEHRVLILSTAGRRVAAESMGSADGEHGRGVLRAAWTPDSRFFVFSTASSGGHSSWHCATYAFVRSRRRIFYLDDLAGGPISRADFQVYPPDRLVSARISGDPAVESLPVDVYLSALRWPR